MHMDGFLHRSLLMMVLFSWTAAAWSQASGFNLSGILAHSLVKGEKFINGNATAIGLAYHHDLGPRFGLALSYNFAFDETAKANEFIYSARYFFSDNDESAVYAGTFIGVQSMKSQVTEYFPSSTGGYSSSRNFEATKLQVPIGVQLGVRGGLDGYFGELFVQTGYAIGNGILYSINTETATTTPLYFGIGFSFIGFGWDH